MPLATAIYYKHDWIVRYLKEQGFITTTTHHENSGSALNSIGAQSPQLVINSFSLISRGSRGRTLENFRVLSLHTCAVRHNSIQTKNGILHRKSQRKEARRLTEARRSERIKEQEPI
jgi:hypothetical protein